MSDEQDASYRGFWASVGGEFPDLGGTESTRYYFECERRLLQTWLSELAGTSIFKTDLWDEARNTRILQWADQQGAAVHGIDISAATLHLARDAFPPGQLRAAVGDVRRIPFRDASFDAVYSMGTIEHFPETEQALAEIHRVLKPGGRAIVGVPNRWDPFLRPLLVVLLYRLGLYAYGYEKSYSRHALRQMMHTAGFRVLGETGILFLPGWLRMAELFCFQHFPPFGYLLGLAVRPFAALARAFPTLLRHGYLIAAIGEKPA